MSQRDHSHVRYGQQFRRGRFFNFPVQNLHLSSRFGTIPLPMERGPHVELHQPDPALSDRQGLNPYQPLPPIGVAMETAALLSGLYSRLPPYTGKLTSCPVQLSQEEELAVLRELHSQVRYVDMAKLKQVYLELANRDDQLSGLCAFEDLNQAFLRNNIYLSNPVARLVASVFLSPYEAQMVNYEKVLSFVGASLHLGQHQPPGNSSQYYQTHPQAYGQYSDRMNHYHQQDYSQTDESHNGQHRRQPSPPPPPPPKLSAPSPPPSPSRSSIGGGSQTAAAAALLPPVMSTDRKLPQALRQLEAEVAAFLSSSGRDEQRQPWPPVNFESLRLAFQRADRLMRGTLSRDQMKRLVWDSRLPFSEPLLDSLVGLCRHRGGGQYDWEQFVGLLEKGLAAHSTGLRIPVARQPLDYAKQLPEPNASWPHAEHPQPTARMPATPLYRGSSPQQLPMSVMVEPWFNRYMKLADALYRRDSEARGILSESQVREVVLSYNATYQLGIGAAAVQAALDASRGAGGRVNINELLRRLSIKPPAARI